MKKARALFFYSLVILVLFFGEAEGKTALFGSALPGPRPLVINPDVWLPLGTNWVVLVNP
ncbi:MAG: hypothetical protein ABFS17_13425 [Chloroflexota bacterium]